MSIANSPYRTQVIQELEQIPEEYLSSLLKIIQIFHESISLKPADESFRQGLARGNKPRNPAGYGTLGGH